MTDRIVPDDGDYLALAVDVTGACKYNDTEWRFVDHYGDAFLCEKSDLVRLGRRLEASMKEAVGEWILKTFDWSVDKRDAN